MTKQIAIDLKSLASTDKVLERMHWFGDWGHQDTTPRSFGPLTDHCDPPSMSDQEQLQYLRSLRAVRERSSAIYNVCLVLVIDDYASI